MIDNKQVNIWRGSLDPPTIYHVWIQDDSKMLLYNGTEWIIFIDDITTVQRINELYNQVQQIGQDLTSLSNNTVNNKKIKDNPVLGGSDIILNRNGTFINSSDNISDAIVKIDTLLSTQIIE